MDNVVEGDGNYIILRRIRHIKNLKNRYKMLNIFFSYVYNISVRYGREGYCYYWCMMYSICLLNKYFADIYESYCFKRLIYSRSSIFL